MIRFTALSLERWRNVTQRKGEYRELLKQSNGSHGGIVGALSDGDCLPVLLDTFCSKYLVIP